MTCETFEEDLVCDAAVSETEEFQVVDKVQFLPQLGELLASVFPDDRVDRLHGGFSQEAVKDDSF